MFVLFSIVPRVPNQKKMLTAPVDHTVATVFDDYLCSHWKIDLKKLSSRQVSAPAWNSVLKGLDVSADDCSKVEVISRAVLYYLARDRDGGAILPGLDQVPGYKDCPLASVKNLLQRWASHSSTDKALRQGLLPEVREIMRERAYSEHQSVMRESVGRQTRPTSEQDDEEGYLALEERLAALRDMQRTAGPVNQFSGPHLQQSPLPNPCAQPWFEPAQFGQQQQHQPLEVRNIPSYQSRTAHKKDLPGRLARNFDNVPVDNRVILQDAVLLVAERWPTAQPDRVYDALVKRFHTNLKQTSANKTVLAEVGVYCGQRLAQHVRLVFF
eukprot:PhM_4_TR2388/c3_g2_i1/m.10341